MPKPLILTVDDDPEYQTLLADKLKASGFSVIQASDGNEGVAAASTKQPDLILMDVQMPNKNGIEAASELHKNPQTTHVRLVFLTQLGDPWQAASSINRRFAKEIGAVDYFRKGGELKRLIDMIKDILAGKQPAHPEREPAE